MDFKSMSKQITKFAGGKGNIALVDHCATRVRLAIVDESLVDIEALEQIEGILGVIAKDNLEIAIGEDVVKVFKELRAQGLTVNKNTSEPVYNTVENWRLAFFALNNTATNMYMFGMAYVSYYATGIAGLMVTTVGFILTAMRLWDGLTDPIVGFLIDKTDGKFGKFRPFMVLGNVMLAVMMLIIFHTTHLIPESFRLLYFVVMYAIYIIGYTFQTACTKAGQSCLTNDPKQRPRFGLYDAIYNSILFTAFAIFISNILVPKYGGFTNIDLFHELILWVIGFSAIFTTLAVIGIWTRDRTEFFGLGGSNKVSMKDYWPVIKENKPLKMLIVAAGTDKLAITVSTNATVVVMLYGIVIGDYGLSGVMGFIILIPKIIITMFGTNYAGKFGQKKALVFGTQAAMISYMLMFLLLFLGDPRQISLSNMGFMTISYIVIQIISQGAVGVSGAFVIPMISDCADYETYRTGRFVPGMMGTLFSFVDKFISSFSTMIVAFAVAAIGFTSVMPDVTDTYTESIFWVTMILYIGLPMLGWLASLIAMKFYDLDGEKMAVVQAHLAAEKAKELQA